MSMNRDRGFTLAELAITLVIVGLLLASAFVPLNTQIELRAITDTRRIQENAKDAIIGFAQTNGRLPCPALGTIPTGSNSAGIEQIDTTINAPAVFPYYPCKNSIGVLPWATLGVPETDAWGKRFTYRVVGTFADGVKTSSANVVNPVSGLPNATQNGDTQTANQSLNCTSPTPIPTQASFALCSRGDLTVNTRGIATHASTALASEIPLAIVSHGKNGHGAYTPAGVLVPGTSGADETANTIAGNAKSFMSREYSPYASGCSDATSGNPLCEFDDIVAWIPYPTLMMKMVGAGKLP